MSDIKRVGGTGSALSSSSVSSASSAKIEGTPGVFAQSLSDASGALIISELEAIMNEIDNQAKNLQKQKTFVSMKRYKDLVKSFMKVVTDNLYVLRGIESTDALGRQKVLKRVEEVENSLEELTSRVLGTDNENVDVLARMDDIRGMLVDLKG